MPPRPSSSRISYPGTVGRSAGTVSAGGGQSPVVRRSSIGQAPFRGRGRVPATEVRRDHPTSVNTAFWAYKGSRWDGIILSRQERLRMVKRREKEEVKTSPERQRRDA